MTKSNKKNTKEINLDIKIDIVKDEIYTKKHKSQLQLRIKGKDNNYIFINSIRRVLIDDIPIYGFDSSLIKIEENTTNAFDNDQMRLRLSIIPIFDLKNILKNNFISINDYSKESNTHKLVELYINVKNTTNQIMNVKTDTPGVVLRIDNEETNFTNPNPILLIKLRPNEVFKSTSKGVIGIGENNILWSSVSSAYYDYEFDEEDNVLLTIESRGQISEKKLFKKACEYLISQLDTILTNTKSAKETEEIDSLKLLELELVGEDFTIGNIINYVLQSDVNVIYSGLSKQDYMIKTIMLKIQTKPDISPLESFYDAIEYLKKLYTHMISQVKS